MKIQHIFNEVKREGNKRKLHIEEGCFDLDYIDEVIKCVENNKTICKTKKECENLNDEAKLALRPIIDESIIDKYDDKKLREILDSFKSEEIYLINGDFFGIQHFIFSNLSTKRAAKILRARSAMVQLITKVISKILEEKLNSKLILFGAGKFLMLSEKIDDLKDVEKELNKIFFKNYFGESGVILNYVKTTKRDLLNQENNVMKNTLIELGKKNEESKYQKFKDSLKEPIINVFEEAKRDDEICEYCKKRVKDKNKEACEICENEIKLGALLTKKNFVEIDIKEDNEEVLDDEVLILEFNSKKYIATFLTKKYVEENIKNKVDCKNEIFDISTLRMNEFPKWPLKSYVPLDKDGNIKTFEEIEENSSGLMVLKADVDRLGSTFKEFYFNSFRKFNRLSRELNFFFANYVPFMISQNSKYKENIYIVFAGGDDLFMIGRYDVIVEFAKDLRDRFHKFSLEKATLSMGLVMFKSSTPVSYISEWADEAEKEAKRVKDKNGNDRDGICLFDRAMKFNEFKYIEKKLDNILKKEGDKINNSVLYKLIEIIDMADKENENITNTLWISKLAYLAKRRNYSLDFVKDLRDLIKDYKGKVLPSLYLQIYKRRDNV